jgi:serine/threonine protein kinase
VTASPSDQQPVKRPNGDHVIGGDASWRYQCTTDEKIQVNCELHFVGKQTKIYTEISTGTDWVAKLYDNRWRYIDNIGGGGQGSVVRVTDDTGAFPGELALKRLTNADSQERRARFERETKVLEELDHPNILRIGV